MLVMTVSLGIWQNTLTYNSYFWHYWMFTYIQSVYWDYKHVRLKKKDIIFVCLPFVSNSCLSKLEILSQKKILYFLLLHANLYYSMLFFPYMWKVKNTRFMHTAYKFTSAGLSSRHVPSSTLVWLKTAINQRKTSLTQDWQMDCSWDSRSSCGTALSHLG